MKSMLAASVAHTEPAHHLPADPHPQTAVPAPSESAADATGERPSRHARIAAAAYRRAEQRGFTPGAELDDWLQAEREIDAEDARED